MLMRQKPNGNVEYYICDNEESRELQLMGFHPKYLFEDEFYYIMTKELKNYLEGGEKM